MFKKFKDKLAEEMKQSPARLQASMQQLAQAVVSPSLSNSSIQDLSSKDNFSLIEETDETPKNSPLKHGFHTIDLTPPSTNSERRSSVSSNVSDASFLFPIYESPGSMYQFQSDMDQSASEIDENINPQLDHVSKDQLYSSYRKAKNKYDKYKGRFTDLASHYREIERAKAKLESLLVETQDKALRRISDLKEQCQLEQQAKAHLEDALRNDLEEKDHIINSLKTKIKLIQEKSPNIDTLENIQLPEDNNVKEEMLLDLTSNVEKSNDDLQLTEENLQFKDKMQKIESLLEKYKDMLKRSKDKIHEVTNEKNTLDRDYDVLQKSSKEEKEELENKMKNLLAETIQLREEINVIRKREEESVISLAENKLSIHRELEEKEEEIKKLRSELKASVEQEKFFKNKVDILNQELEKFKLLAKEYSETNKEHMNKNQALQEMQANILESESKMNSKYNDEVNKTNKLIMKIEELENQSRSFQSELTAEKNDNESKREKYEQIIRDHESQNNDLKKNLLEMKNLIEKLKSEEKTEMPGLNNVYLTELETLKQTLLDKNLKCEKLDAKIQEYTETIKHLKCKLQSQEEEIKVLSSKDTNEEKISKLQDDLEIRNTEVLSLSTEVKSSSGTIQDLKKEISILTNQKNVLLKCLKIYKKATASLQEDCDTIKCNANNGIFSGQDAIKKIVFRTNKILTSLNEQNVAMQTQANELTEKLKIMEKIQSNCEDNNVQLEQLLCDKVQLEKELKEKHNELLELKSQIKKVHELETSNNLSILEIERLNKRQKEMEIEFSEKDKRFQTLKSELMVVKEENISKTTELDDLSTKYSEEMEGASRMAKDLKHLKQLLDEKSQQLSVLQNDYEIIEESNKQFIYESKLSETWLQNTEQDKNELLQKLQDLKKQIEDDKEKIQDFKQHIEKDQAEWLQKIAAMESQVQILQSENSHLISFKEINANLTAEVQKLSNLNESLCMELEQIKNQVRELEEYKMKNSNLEIELNSSQSKITELENTLSTKVQELNSFCNSSVSKAHDLQIELEEKNGELKEIESKNAKLMEKLDELVNEKITLEEKANTDIKSLQEKCSRLKNEIKDVNLCKAEDESLTKNLQMVISEKTMLESQLDETLVTFQSKEKQMQALNEELRHQANQLREQIKLNEEEQSLRLKQIGKEFQAQLHDKEQELQAALEKRFDRQQTYESDIIQEYKEQLKDFQVELTKKSQEIEKLEISNESTKKQLQQEIVELQKEMNKVKQEYKEIVQNENQKWHERLKQKTDELEVKRGEEISELTNQWQNERNNDVHAKSVKNEELENTAKVAMAAVQSNTGSLHTLQQTLMSQKMELAELRKLVKMKQDSVEDSTEIEYLRNILFKYMMGKETMVLAKVIAAVVKFDQDQTSKVLKKEEDKLTLFGQLGLT